MQGKAQIRAVVLVALALASGSCARGSNPGSGALGQSPVDFETNEPTVPPSGVQPLPSDVVNNPFSGTDWDNPLADGVILSTVAEAQSYVSFKLVGPENIDRPARVSVNGPIDEAMPDRMAAFVYDTDRYGRIDLTEGVAQMSPEQWQQAASDVAANTGKPGYYGSGETIPLQPNLTALITTTADGSISVVEWQQAGVDLTIYGPTLDRAAVQQLALIVSSG